MVARSGVGVVEISIVGEAGSAWPRLPQYCTVGSSSETLNWAASKSSEPGMFARSHILHLINLFDSG